MTRVSGAWLTSEATQTVLAMLETAGHTALVVGGCVRNALLGLPVSDVDIATDARPETVIAQSEAAGLRAIPTGEEHGTITVVAQETAFEITTFRADVETDGRHAVVRFSRDVAEDAARRDFTMNALYADRRGHVIDPLGGLPDLQARRVRFIGDPNQRIAEDYLRILRFFRFSAWYGDPALGLDPDGLDAAARGQDGLARVSRERIGAELLRLLAAPDPARALAGMASSGVLAALLPGADARALAPLIHLEGEADIPPDPLRRLAALGATGAENLRLRRADAKRLALLANLLAAEAGLAEVAWRHGAAAATDTALLRGALGGGGMPDRWQDAVAQGAGATFPVTAKDLMPDYEGAALGACLAGLERDWIASGFALTREALLARSRK